MKTEWKSFLEKAGAVVEQDQVRDFGNAVREARVVNSGSIIADLSHNGLIAIYGDDAREFLQGQLTNDTNTLSETHSHLSGMCNPKGRLLAITRIFMRSDTFYMQLPRDILEDTIKKLRMYVLRSKVTIEDATDTFVRMGFSGPNSEKQLRDVISSIPENVNDVLQQDNMTIIRIPGINPRFLVIGELDSVRNLWNKLDVHAAPVGASTWALTRIYAGIPPVYESTREMYVPQSVNLDLIDGVSFKKGCYTGQEIVARMHYLGKPKQRMYLAHVKMNETPQPGTALYAGESDNRQAIGNIVDARPSPDGNQDLLVTIKIQYLDNPVCVGSADGPEIEIRQLPYSLEAES